MGQIQKSDVRDWQSEIKSITEMNPSNRKHCWHGLEEIFAKLVIAKIVA